MSEFVGGAPAPVVAFTPGFAARHALAAEALQRAFAPAAGGFVPARPSDLLVTPEPEAFAAPKPEAFQTRPPGPKHFSPADRAHNPTEGWDPLDPTPPATPYVDPVAAARDAGYAEGLAAARAALDEAGDRDRALLAELLDRLAAGHALDREAIAQRLRETVLTLVGKVVGEVGVSAELLARRIEAATKHLADAGESALLRVHPDDVALLEGRLPPAVFAAGDAEIARGCFVLESASTIVEDGPALWLDQLAEAIDGVALPTNLPC